MNRQNSFSSRCCSNLHSFHPKKEPKLETNSKLTKKHHSSSAMMMMVEIKWKKSSRIMLFSINESDDVMATAYFMRIPMKDLRELVLLVTHLFIVI
jgi:hypothetical protein